MEGREVIGKLRIDAGLAIATDRDVAQKDRRRLEALTGGGDRPDSRVGEGVVERSPWPLP